jgi:hypothetical protein
MTIFRAKHKKNYTVINNTICTDKRLSFKAKGIWLYAFSRPDDWEFNLTDIVNQSLDGRDSVRNGLKELEENGYLERCQPREIDGKYSYAEWEFHEEPILKKLVPKTENPHAAGQLTENPTLLNTDYLPITKKQQQQGAAAPNPAAAVSFYECLKKVDIPQSEKVWLSKKYDIPTVEHAIDFATHPLTKIETTLIQTIKWACEAKPAIPVSQADRENENKELAKKLEATLKLPSNVRFEALNKYVEIGYTIGQNVPVVIEYGVAAFREVIKKALEDHGMKFKTQT